MQRKLFVLFSGLVLFSMLIAPAGMAGAQVETQASSPNCPPFDSSLMRDKGFLQSLPPECSKSYQKLTQEGGNQANKPDITPLAVGGPDAFGYTYDDAVSYSWISATTDSGLTGDDDYSAPINIGFNFPFYGLPQSQLYFSTNGLITFRAGSWDRGGGIPNSATPNNLIAPFWEDLVVGSPYNSGAIYYSQGGAAPNRYFVIEWRDVTTYNGSSAFSFEAILYENGDVVVQHQSLPASYYSTVGIENSVGDEGLEYQFGFSGLSAPKAIRFYYPAPAARVLVSPLEAGSFSAIGGTADFVITVANTGSLGADTYNLTAASAWPVTFYAADGVTPLTDTDSDGTVDTGSLAQGSAVNIIAKVATPGGAVVGNANSAIITVRSSRDTSKSKIATLQTAVPAPFAQVYKDNADGAMSLYLVQPNAQTVKKATADDYYGYDMAVAETPNGNFVYAWTTGRCLDSNCNVYVSEVEYTLLDRYGNTVLPVTKLTNHSGATMETYDSLPAVAVAPNGRIGVLWDRYLWNSSASLGNDNIYFAVLDASGNVVYGPANITNNNIWGTGGDLNVPYFYNLRIAATGDNNFVMAWQREHEESAGRVNDIYYAVRNGNGGEVRASTKFTNGTAGGERHFNPSLTRLAGNRVLLGFQRANYNTNTSDIYFGVLDSSGNTVQAMTNLSGDGATVWNWKSDATQLSDGKTIVAWSTDSGSIDRQIRFAVLDNSYNRIGGITTLNNPAATAGNNYVSIAPDASGHAILTWMDGDWNSRRNLYYALVDGSGTVLTPPMIFRTSQATNPYIFTSYEGYGNTSYNNAPVITSDGGGTSANLNVPENTTAVTTVTATDADSDTLIYSISGGADAAFFSINASTGVLTFISAPNFEIPLDVGANNTYEVIVQVSDGTLTDTQTITVTVTDVTEIYTIFLPLTLRDLISYFEGPWEQEPNNSYLEANGPLRSGQDYYGYPNDAKDYFSIYLRTGGQITIDLTNHTGTGTQLQMFYQSVANRVASDVEAPYHIDYNGQAGLYYIYAYTAGGYNTTTPYTLRVTYP